MKLSVYSPDQPFLTDVPVMEVIVPSVRGELGILPGHAALISLLQKGVLKYLKEGASKFEEVGISEGYLEIENEHVKILTEAISEITKTKSQ